MVRPEKYQKGVIYYHTAIPSGLADLECLSLTKNTFFHFSGSFFTKVAISQKKFKRELVLHFLPKWAEIWFIGSLGGYFQSYCRDFEYLQNWPSPRLALIFLAPILAKKGLKK